MNYLNQTFTVPAPDKQMPGTCERCVWGRGEHAAECLRKGCAAGVSGRKFNPDREQPR